MIVEQIYVSIMKKINMNGNKYIVSMMIMEINKFRDAHSCFFYISINIKHLKERFGNRQSAFGINVLE